MALANYGRKFSDIISGLRRRQLLTGQPFASKDITNIAEPYFASARESAATESALGLEKQGLEQEASQFSESLSETQRQNASALALEREKIRLGEDEADKNRRLQLASTAIQGLGVGALGAHMAGYNPFAGPKVISEIKNPAPAIAGAPAAIGSGEVGAFAPGTPMTLGDTGLTLGDASLIYAGTRLAGNIANQLGLPGQTGWNIASAPVTGTLAEVGKATGIRELEEPAKFFKDVGGCIIVTACTHRDSYEVGITREYRDRFLDAETLRGYYMLAEKVVPVMKKHGWTKRIIKRFLVDPLISYGEHALDYTDIRPSAYAVMVKVFFLTLCRKVGEKRAQFVRANGEIF